MLEKFYPDAYVDSVFHIDYAELRARGIRGLIFDIDNTLAPFDIPVPPENISALLKRLSGDFQLCLLSNNSERRVQLFNESLGLPAISRAAKPTSLGISRALAIMKTVPEYTALIGDQVFTDMLCGNNGGLYTVLVKPVSERDEFVVRIKRALERRVIKRYLRSVRS